MTNQTRPPIRQEATTERVRKRKGLQAHDPFAIDVSSIPAGTTYEWKRHTVYGQENIGYYNSMREQGWEPVDAGRHPELMANGAKGAVIREGMILMERPAELTAEARAEEIAAARSQVSGRPGHAQAMPEHFKATQSISRSLEQIPD